MIIILEDDQAGEQTCIKIGIIQLQTMYEKAETQQISGAIC